MHLFRKILTTGIPVFFVAFLYPLPAQNIIELDGYLNDMQTVYFIEDDDWYWENQVHNRLNLHLYPTSWLTGSIQLRNRFIQGSTVGKFPGYSETITGDAGWADLSFTHDGTYSDHTGYILSSMIDRAWLEFTAGNFVATIGRQRINWGQTFVWNPNDIFNTYSYFEVDYRERPGSDALRLQYYTGMASTMELAAKIDSAGRITAAGYYRFNAGGYDVQVLGGILREEDLVLGTGWSGNLGNTAFRGELSYFRDLDRFKDTTGYLIASAGWDYMFKNSLWIRGEILYSSLADELRLSGFLQLLSSGMDVKTIGFTEWSLYTSASYPITPRLNSTLAIMYYPDWKGLFAGPSLDYNVAENFDLSLIFQLFSAELKDFTGTRSRKETGVGYLRAKWSF